MKIFIICHIEALRANIDQVKLNRSVNALVRDLDLGVSIEDLTFGQPC